MNAIIGMSSFLLGTDLTNKQLDFAKRIDFSSRVLLDIINDILDFSKIEAGKIDIDIHNFSFKDLLLPIESMLSPLAQLMGSDLKVESQEARGSTFYFEMCMAIGDPAKLREGLENSQKNSTAGFKGIFHPGGGRY